MIQVSIEYELLVKKYNS